MNRDDSRPLIELRATTDKDEGKDGGLKDCNETQVKPTGAGTGNQHGR